MHDFSELKRDAYSALNWKQASLAIPGNTSSTPPELKVVCTRSPTHYTDNNMKEPFDIRPAGESRGIGVFAKKFIPRGTVILEEKPVLKVEIGKPWSESAWQRLTESERNAILELHEPDLPTHTHAKTKLARIIQGNCFGDETHSTLYIKASRFNHSCVANAVVNAGTVAIVRATKDIRKGQEIEISYSDDIEEVLTARQRATLFQVRYDFACHCPACHPETAPVSDGRRQLIKILRYALQGSEEPGFTLLENANARTFSWPPPTSPLPPRRRLTAGQEIVYTFLLARLRQAEGLNPAHVSAALVDAAELLMSQQERSFQNPVTKDIFFLKAARCLREWYAEAISLREQTNGSDDEDLGVLKLNWKNIQTASVITIPLMILSDGKWAGKEKQFAMQCDEKKPFPPNFLFREQVEKLLRKRTLQKGRNG